MFWPQIGDDSSSCFLWLKDHLSLWSVLKSLTGRKWIQFYSVMLLQTTLVHGLGLTDFFFWFLPKLQNFKTSKLMRFKKKQNSCLQHTHAWRYQLQPDIHPSEMTCASDRQLTTLNNLQIVQRKRWRNHKTFKNVKLKNFK